MRISFYLKKLNNPPEVFHQRPKILYFFPMLEIAFAALLLFQFLLWGLPWLKVSPQALFPAGLGFIFIVAGIPFFLGASRLGWVFFFLGHVSLILNALTQILLRHQINQFSYFKTITGVLINIFLLRILFTPYIFKIFNNPKSNLWNRAARFSVDVKVLLNYSFKTVEGNIVDISESGCLLTSHSDIPVGEVLKFNSESFCGYLQIQRKFLQDNNSTKFYGCNFRDRINEELLQKILKEQTQHSLQGP